MAKVKWSLQALNDVEAIGKFIEKVSLQCAEQQVQTIVERAAQLQKFSFMAGPFPKLVILLSAHCFAALTGSFTK